MMTKQGKMSAATAAKTRLSARAAPGRTRNARMPKPRGNDHVQARRKKTKPKVAMTEPSARTHSTVAAIVLPGTVRRARYAVQQQKQGRQGEHHEYRRSQDHPCVRRAGAGG